MLYLLRNMFLECWRKQRTCLDRMLLLVVLHVSNILKGTVSFCLMQSQTMTKYLLLYTILHKALQYCVHTHGYIPSHFNIHHCTKNCTQRIHIHVLWSLKHQLFVIAWFLPCAVFSLSGLLIPNSTANQTLHSFSQHLHKHPTHSEHTCYMSYSTNTSNQHLSKHPTQYSTNTALFEVASTNCLPILSTGQASSGS